MRQPANPASVSAALPRMRARLCRNERGGGRGLFTSEGSKRRGGTLSKSFSEIYQPVILYRVASTAIRRDAGPQSAIRRSHAASIRCPRLAPPSNKPIIVEGIAAHLSVYCFLAPLPGSSYPPCASDTPICARVPHRSGLLRQSWAFAAQAKPELSADLGSARANPLSVKYSVGFIGKFRSGPTDAGPAPFIIWHVKHLFTKADLSVSRRMERRPAWDRPRARASHQLCRVRGSRSLAPEAHAECCADPGLIAPADPACHDHRITGHQRPH